MVRELCQDLGKFIPHISSRGQISQPQSHCRCLEWCSESVDSVQMYELRRVHLRVGDPSLCRTELEVEARGAGTISLGHQVSAILQASHKLETQTWPPMGIFVKIRGLNIFYRRVFSSTYNLPIAFGYMDFYFSSCPRSWAIWEDTA